MSSARRLGKRPPLSPPRARGAGRDAGHRSGDARQSRTDAHACRRAARLAARHHRPHRHGGRRAAAGRTPRRAAHRSRRRSRAGSTRSSASCRRGRRAATCASGCSAAPDLARALSRLAVGRGGPRDLAAHPRRHLRRRPISPSAFGGSRATARATSATPLRRCARPDPALAPSSRRRSPTNCRCCKPRRRLRARRLRRRRSTRRARCATNPAASIAALQARYAEETGVRDAEDPAQQRARLFRRGHGAARRQAARRAPPTRRFIHRQTLAGQVRFTTAELGELEAKIASAADRALALELAIFERLAAAVAAARPTSRPPRRRWRCSMSRRRWPTLAAERDYVRPAVDDSLDFVHRGRPPSGGRAGAAADGGPFVANDCDLSPPTRQGRAGRIWLITGPNMAGKSTFLRQNALIAVLAQMGSFVPARARPYRRRRPAVLPRRRRRRSRARPLDLHGRDGRDRRDPQPGDERSLVILDEIGRGTATFDGLSIAWATIEHLHETQPLPRAVRHAFPRADRARGEAAAAANATMRVKEWHGDVVFLHEVVPGAADRSYGIQVAKLAGLPARVIERAKLVLAAARGRGPHLAGAPADRRPAAVRRARRAPRRRRRRCRARRADRARSRRCIRTRCRRATRWRRCTRSRASWRA